MYQIYDLTYDGKPIYVGQTNRSLINRYGRHLMSIDDTSKKQKLYEFLRTKTPDEIQENLRIELLEDGLKNTKEADKAEMKWIKELDTKNNGLNSTNGGGGGGRNIPQLELDSIMNMYYNRNMKLKDIEKVVGRTKEAIRNIIDRHSDSPVRCTMNPTKVPWDIDYCPFDFRVE